MKPREETAPVPVPDAVERAIRVVRGHRVILDADVATLHGVETRASESGDSLGSGVYCRGRRTESNGPADVGVAR